MIRAGHLLMAGVVGVPGDSECNKVYIQVGSWLVFLQGFGRSGFGSGIACVGIFFYPYITDIYICYGLSFFTMLWYAFSS